MTGRDKLSLIRKRWASRHGVGAPARVVADEIEPDAPEVWTEADESEAVDLDSIQGGSEEWSAGLAVYGD